MSKPLRIALLILVVLGVLGLTFWALGGRSEGLPRARVLADQGTAAYSPRSGPLSAVGDQVGRDAPPGSLYESASPDYGWRFPQDFGAHPDYQTEWWYYTGNLETSQGRRFGYELTFFRRALLPPGERQARTSAWAVEQVYLAHFAISDIEAGEFHAFEQLARGSAGLAGVQAVPFQAWLYDWQVIETESGVYQLSAAQDGYTISLTLTDSKGPILQGINGYSQKGPEPGNASQYFSQTRLESTGELQVRGERFLLSGLSWMDHEFSTSALSAGRVGWDWFALQLEDGSELMVYLIRLTDGSVDRFSSGTYIYPDGSTLHLELDDLSIQALDKWKSPHSGATYPSGWQMSVPSLDLSLEIQPYQADQELNVSYSYWEGAVGVTGALQGAALSGSGYVELTGYAGSMSGDF